VRCTVLQCVVVCCSVLKIATAAILECVLGSFCAFAVCVSVCVHARACVCVRERERERDCNTLQHF